MDDTRLRGTARRIRDLVEPLAAHVYFAPQAHAAFEKLGFGPGNPGRDGLVSPDLPAYFTSRGACMGVVSGDVVAAAFGVFPRELVVPMVEAGWKTADRDSILGARLDGARAALDAIIGRAPGIERATELLRRAAEAAGGEGRHLFSGLRSLGFPGDPLGDLWRAADLVREHRGDSHVAAWISHGLDAVEICLLTDAWMGLPFKSYSRTRGWSREQLDAGLERLRSRGLVDGDALTEAGRARRDEIEWATDVQERALCEALGDDADELWSLLEPWAKAIVDAKAYPATPPKPR